jgi:hypothetical protein
MLGLPLIVSEGKNSNKVIKKLSYKKVIKVNYG